MKKEQTNNIGRKDFLFIALILLIAIVLRVYKIGIPLADFHSWRQADTAAVARNFVKHDFNLLEPKYDDLSNIQSGKDNPQGYRMVEFPLYSGLVALLYKYIPLTSLEVWGRITTIFFSLIVIGIIYFFLFKEVGRFAAVVGSTTYAIFPFFVFFSRVILPETTAVSLAFLALLFLYLYCLNKTNTKNVIYLTISVVFFSLGILIKPTVIFFLLSAFYLFFRKYQWSFYKKISFYAFFVLTILPFFLWRYHITFYPEGIPSTDTLIFLVNTPQGKEPIFLRPAFFRWVFFERINNIIFGGFLTAFFVLGLLVKPRRLFLHSILASSVLYLLVFQGGNVQHEYYQTLILPALAIFVGVGVNFIVTHYKLFLHPVLTGTLIITVFSFSFFISYYRVRDYYSYPVDLPSIAKIIKDLTSENDKIITDTTGDTTLLYLSQRRGAPAVYKNLPALKKDGYSYFVTYNKELVETLKNEGNFSLIFENEKFALFRL